VSICIVRNFIDTIKEWSIV